MLDSLSVNEDPVETKIQFVLIGAVQFLIRRKYPGTSKKCFLVLSSFLKIPIEKVEEDYELRFHNPCVRKSY